MGVCLGVGGWRVVPVARDPPPPIHQPEVRVVHESPSRDKPCKAMVLLKFMEKMGISYNNMYMALNSKTTHAK